MCLLFLGIGSCLFTISLISPVNSTSPNYNEVTFQSEDGSKLTFQTFPSIQARSGITELLSVTVRRDMNTDESDASIRKDLDDLWMFSLKVPGMRVHPSGEIFVTVQELDMKKLTWNLHSKIIGNYEGTLWVYHNGENHQAVPIFAIPMKIENKGFLGIAYHHVRNVGYGFLMGSFLCFILFVLLKLTRLTKENRAKTAD